MKNSGVVDAEEMAAVELNAEYLGVSRLLLMENAGRAIATEIAKRVKRQACIAIFAGLGGNGGDGFVAARHLAPHYHVHLVVLGDPCTIRNKAAAANWRIVTKMKHSLQIHVVNAVTELPDIEASAIVDALLGTGVKGAPRPPVIQALRLMNQMPGVKLAVDIPTGIHPNTGERTTDAAFCADFTVTFHRPKTGLILKKENVGKLVIADIGIPPEAELCVGPGDVLRVYKPRSPYTKKGDFGQLLVIGGSSTYIGAPILASAGALRSGVDLVYLAAPPNVISAAAHQFPDIIPLPLPDHTLTPSALPMIQGALGKVDALLIGPGLGYDNNTLNATNRILSIITEQNKPVVIDADALKAVSVQLKLGSTTVITPHAGEFRRITGQAVSDRLRTRGQQAQDLAAQLDCVVLLKGPVDVIASPHNTRYNWTGTPTMSVGGTGDVLAGICSGICAQGVQPYLAACVGAFINGAAGQHVSHTKGPSLIASDLIDAIPKVITHPMATRAEYPFTVSIRD